MTEAIDTIVYECNGTVVVGNDIPKYLCWITQQAIVKDKQGKPTGAFKTVFLPVYFKGETAKTARQAAIAFWHDEKAKEAAKKARGKAVGSRRAA